MHLQKEVKSNQKKCAAPEKAIVKKMGNQRWQPRNGCDGRLIARILITTIQVNLVPNSSELWGRYSVSQINLNWS